MDAMHSISGRSIHHFCSGYIWTFTSFNWTVSGSCHNFQSSLFLMCINKKNLDIFIFSFNSKTFYKSCDVYILHESLASSRLRSKTQGTVKTHTKDF